MAGFKVTGASAEQSRVIAAFEARHAASFASVEVSLTVGRCTAMTRETYCLSAARDGAAITATADVTDLHSLRWALNHLRRWHIDGGSEGLSVEARPDFRYRGLIEGFYGTPWTHAQRLRGIEAFGDYNMNMFLVAPKDAKWQRAQWREPLNAAFVAELSQLVSLGADHGVDVSACVSPGLSVVYSSQADVDAVVAKFMQLAAIGSKHFGLLLDDIPDTLTHEDDIAAYPNIAVAHADFANRVRETLIAQMPSAHLILCPMHYAGRGTEPYCHVMGDALHPQIDLMWTGREICSGYLDIADAVVFERSTRRPPFYWDNYPVNDGSMATRLHIGPIEGREAGLHRYSAGLLANPMEHFESSLLPLGTIGDYLWSTTTYDAWKSWDAVLADLVPIDADREAIREFFRNTLGMTGAWSPAFNVIIGECATAWRSGKPEVAAAAALAGAARIRNAHAVITAADFCAPLIRAEIQPWLDKYVLGASWLERMAAVLSTCSVGADGQLTASSAAGVELNDIRANLNTNARRLFGDGFDIMLGELAAEIAYTD